MYTLEGHNINLEQVSGKPISNDQSALINAVMTHREQMMDCLEVGQR